jgi:hypothetical protein
MAVIPKHVRNLRDGTLTIQDGGANSVEVVLDEGNLVWRHPSNIAQIKDRGVLDHLRPGDQEAVTFSFGIKYTRLLADTGQGTTGEGETTVYEAITKTGRAAAWASVGQTYEPYEVKMVFRVDDPAGLKDETITFNKVAIVSVEHAEGDPASTLKVECLDYEVTPTIAAVAV